MPTNTPSIGEVAFTNARKAGDALWRELMPETQEWIECMCAAAVAEHDKNRLRSAVSTIHALNAGRQVGVWQKLTSTPDGCPEHNRTIVIAFADNGTSTPVTAGGETLEEVVENMVNQLKAQQA